MYLDSAIIIKLVVHETDSLFYARKLQGKSGFCSSVVSLTECFSALCRKEREKMITSQIRIQAWALIEGFVANGNIQLVDVTRNILKQANHFLELCHPQIPLRSLDAIHLASCQQVAGWPIYSNDQRMRDAAKYLKIQLADIPPGKHLM